MSADSSPPPAPQDRDPIDHLRIREVPSGALDDFYATLRERLPLAPVNGGMSVSFLRAPRTLRAWRATAVAASLLLAVGTGLLATGRLSTSVPSRGTEVPLQDARGQLLDDLEISNPAERNIQNVDWWPRFRAGRAFFQLPPKPGVPTDGPKRWN